MKKKSIAMMLALIMAFSGVQPVVFAREMGESKEAYVDFIKPAPVLPEFAADCALGAYEELPAKYFPKEELAPVKDQGDFGFCWAYATCSAMEDGVYRRLGKKLSGDDLFDPLFFTDVVDRGRVSPFGLTRGDESRRIYKGDNYNDRCLAMILSGGIGPMSYRQTSSGTMDKLGYGDSEYRADNIFFLDTEDIHSIKRAVMKYGSVTIGIDANPLLIRSVSENGVLKLVSTHYLYKPLIGEVELNHLVAIVGWDDTIPAEKFHFKDGDRDYDSMYDGGFIIKNSWGDAPYVLDAEKADDLRKEMGLIPTGEEVAEEDSGDDGYYYISYYDQSIKRKNGFCSVYDMADAERNENVYMYDGTGNIAEMSTFVCANRFTAQSGSPEGGEELVRAIVGVSDPGKYTLSVYNCADPEKAPWEQTLVGSKDFTAAATGFHSVEFDKGISFLEGESFALVLRRQNGAAFNVLIDEECSVTWLETFNYTEEGESWFDDLEYLDFKGKTPRIKAVTKDCKVSASRSQALENKAKIRAIPDQMYKGEVVTLSGNDLQVYKGDTLLTPGLDYDTEYKKNTGVGRATVTVKPKTGNTTEVKASFYIVKDPTNPLVGKDKYSILSKEGLDLSVYYPGASFETEKSRIIKLDSAGRIIGKKRGKATVTVTYPDGTEKDIGIVVEKPKSNKVTVSKTTELNIRKFYSSLGYAYPVSVTSSKPDVAQVSEGMKITPQRKGSTKLTIMFSDKVKVVARLKVKL